MLRSSEHWQRNGRQNYELLDDDNDNGQCEERGGEIVHGTI
jgi:hypothetical protein